MTTTVALGASAWPGRARLVIAAWTAVMDALAVCAHRRDTGRI